MATQISRRLMAAGASPERARAFEQQFTKKLQSAQPTITKPQDIQDAFDAEIAAFAAVAYPKTFKPPAIDDPKIDAYITGIYGKGKLQELQDKAYSTEAPNFIRIKNTLPKDPNAFNLDQYIIAKIDNGVPYAQIVNDIIEKAPIELMGSLSQGQVADTVNKYYNEYNKAIETIPVNKQKLLESNKYYKVGLPDPSFQYGTKENLSAGVIDFRTHPSVEKYLNTSPEGIKAKQIMSQPAAGYMVDPKNPQASIDAFKKYKQPGFDYVDKIFNELSATKATPVVDEVKRREYLKKRQTK
jgi:hypothetical protein